MPVKKSKLSELKKRIPFKWRVQSQTDYNATCVAYIDARDVQNMLDDVVGPENWSTDFCEIKDQLFCKLGIYVEYEDGRTEWVYKMDTGSEGNIEVEKSLVSDGVKRAAVQWNIGRFLYAMPFQKVKVKKHTNNKFYPCDDAGNILWDSDMLTDFINSRTNKGSKRDEPEKYEKLTESPKYNTPDKPRWSKQVQERASKVEKDGMKGSAALIKYLPQYNEKMNKTYKTIQELDTDEKLISLITYVEDIPPNGLI